MSSNRTTQVAPTNRQLLSKKTFTITGISHTIFSFLPPQQIIATLSRVSHDFQKITQSFPTEISTAKWMLRNIIPYSIALNHQRIAEINQSLRPYGALGQDVFEYRMTQNRRFCASYFPSAICIQPFVNATAQLCCSNTIPATTFGLIPCVSYASLGISYNCGMVLGCVASPIVAVGGMACTNIACQAYGKGNIYSLVEERKELSGRNKYDKLFADLFYPKCKVAQNEEVQQLGNKRIVKNLIKFFNENAVGVGVEQKDEIREAKPSPN